MDKLLVPPLTLHQTIYLHFQVPLGLFLPALPYITDRFQLPLASGNSLMPPYDCSKWAPSCFLAKCFSSMEGIHCKQDKSILLSAFKSLPLSSLLLQWLRKHLALTRQLVAPSCRREHLADLWSEERRGFGKQQKMVIISSSSVSTTVPPKGHNLHSGVAHTNTS